MRAACDMHWHAAPKHACSQLILAHIIVLCSHLYTDSRKQEVAMACCQSSKNDMLLVITGSGLSGYPQPARTPKHNSGGVDGREPSDEYKNILGYVLQMGAQVVNGTSKME